ncbi:SDR family NAD(P)-dependent oxidoreductase [bacterium]|nr:SDR family NAD(P)-dependent oxidoreductase [bacterium]
MTDALAATPAPLAIVGLSCLFPKAGSAEDFWSNIRRGVDAITEVPASHWRPDDYFDSDPKSPDMTYAQRGGFLSSVAFDPLEFGIAPSNLEAIDTSQLLGLVAAKRALENAGYGSDGRKFDRDRVGCILGVTGTLEMVIPLGARLGHPKWKQALKEAGVADDVADDVMARISESYVPWQENSFPGLLGNVVAGRIANRLDLHGTNCVVDAACASSLSAIHLAALELWSGRSDMVLTGGVDTFNDIFMYMCFSKTPALSATGDARPFSDQADGTILGEGVGILVLKRLADAERDGDQIYAVLRGIGTSSDGAGNAVYAPKKEGQIRCLQDAYRISGVTPDTIELVEAHGTGTKVGDATEIAGLTEVYRSSGRTGTWCALGSVKSQIGHTKAAAGVAGVLKAVLALTHRVLPPTIKVERPQEGLLADDSPFYVNVQARPWLSSPDHPRRAAVSAFGFGGSNFHAVLEESPAPRLAPDWDGDVVIAAFSGDSIEALKSQISGWKSTADWAAIRHRAVSTRAEFRPEQEHRLLFVWERDRSDVATSLRSATELLTKYSDRAQWSTPDGIYYGRGARAGKVAVLFPGQGSQYVGMLRELACRFPEMQDVLSEADAAFAAWTDEGDIDFQLSEAIYPLASFTADARSTQQSRLTATQVAQPALGAVSLGGLAVLRGFGLVPEMTAGHSYGELTALCASKRYQSSALYRLSLLRGQLMAAAQEVDGGMLAVGAPLSQVEAAIREHAVDLVVANHNSPNQVVLSGRLPDIERAVELFTKTNIRGKKLPVAAAFHSPLVAAASEKFRPILDEIDFAPAEVPVYANSHAAVYPEDPAAARDVLAGQLAKPVDFLHQIEAMYAAGARCFLEVGPGNVLTGLVGSILSGREHRAIALDASSGKRSSMVDLAMLLAQSAATGVPVTLSNWDPTPPSVSNAGDRLMIPICGANYVKPRTPRPPRPQAPAAPRSMNAPMKSTTAAPVMAPVPAPAPMPSAQVNGSNGPSRSMPTTVPPSATPTQNGAGMTLSPALTALQQMQAETARLHRQFLEGQETALRTLQSLMHGQSPTVTQPTVSAVAPTPRASTAPLAAPAPAPMAAPAAAAPRYSPPPRVQAPAVAPPPAAKPTPALASASTDLTPQVMAVVAEKTGYPIEMLKPSMSLDHDLGIDSIKRVEILSALQEKLPQLPSVTPEQLQTLHRLEDVIGLLGATTVSAPTSMPAVAPVADLTPQVMAVVAEKTGYPIEMLKPTMSLDHDLGIDSIKRVEILSALQEKLPQLPSVTPEQLQTLHRLEDVIGLLGATSTSAPANIPSTAPVTDLTPQVMAVVAEKTGYPIEMLKPTMSLDHDLGIDSIKRVEILSALQEKLPQLPSVTPEQLQTLHRLEDVIRLLGGATANAVTATAALPVTAAPTSAAAHAETGDLIVGRVTTRPVTHAAEREPLAYAAGSEFWITDDGSELALKLAAKFNAAGYKARVVQWDDTATPPMNGPFGGLILLSPQSGTSDAHLWRAIEWIQKTGPALRQSARQGAVLLATVSCIDGEFGLATDASIHDVTAGGFAGLTKTVRHEWPELTCKAIDTLDPASRLAAVDQLFEELTHAGPVECGLTGGQCLEVIATEMASTDSATQPSLQPGDLMLVTGGARGVTATAALAVARATQATLMLLGRSPAPQPEPDYLHGVTDPAHIKQALATHGAASTPKALQQQCQQILAQREITETLAQLRQIGVTAEYHSVDVRDVPAVCKLVEELQKLYGPVRGIIHGAGVLADQRIEDKTREQFEKVFSTKVIGLRNVLGAIDSHELRAMVLFSSFTARYGRKGQIDYAIANEVLNKLAQQWQRKSPECRVLSFNWGPWDGGMVQGGLKDLFAKEGVGLIPLAAGGQLVAQQLTTATSPGVELVVLGPGSQPLEQAAPVETITPEPAAPRLIPEDAKLSFARELSVTTAPYLRSHVLGGKAVLPVAMVTEWLSHAVMHRNPGLDFQGLSGLQIFKGVRLAADETVPLEVHVGKPRRTNGQFLVSAHLLHPQESRPTLHAAGDVVLGTGFPEEPTPQLTVSKSEGRTLAHPYQQLFHGPIFQGMSKVETCSPQGIIVQSRVAPPPATWGPQPLRPQWLAEPLVIDVALQAIILWCRTFRQKPCLPAAMGEYRQYRRSFPSEGVRVVVQIAEATDHKVRADVEFLDPAGRVIATMTGVDNILDEALVAAFGANAL